jgi:hypothetical protein
MAFALIFTTNGSKGGASAYSQIVGILGTADSSTPLDATVFVGTQTDQTKVAHVRAPANTSIPVPLTRAVGIPPGDDQVTVQFADAGAGHEVAVYVE